MDDLISVVIPVYNGAQYLEKCLGSLLAQSYQHWEAILVDDSSTDNSFEVLQEFARRDSRFHAYRKANQRFACHGIRYGVEHAKGKWFCYMSQDDRLSPDYLEQTLAAARSAGAEIALGRLVHFYDDVEEPFEMPVSEGDVISGREAFELSLDWRIHGFCLISMDLIRRLGISTELLNDDEYDTRRQFFSACKVVVSGSTFYYHVGNPQSITRKWDVAQLDYITVAHRLRLLARLSALSPDGLQRIPFGRSHEVRHPPAYGRHPPKPPRVARPLQSSHNRHRPLSPDRPPPCPDRHNKDPHPPRAGIAPSPSQSSKGIYWTKTLLCALLQFRPKIASGCRNLPWRNRP